MIILHKELRMIHALSPIPAACVGLRWVVIWPFTTAQGPYKARDDPGKSIPPLKHHLFVSLSCLIQLTKCLLYVALRFQGCRASSGFNSKMDIIYCRRTQTNVSSPELNRDDKNHSSTIKSVINSGLNYYVFYFSREKI